MVAGHPFLGDGWTQHLSTLTNGKTLVSQSPHHPEAASAHSTVTTGHRLAASPPELGLSKDGPGGGRVSCFVATREGDLGWPQQPCWAWLRMASGCSRSCRFLLSSELNLRGPACVGRPQGAEVLASPPALGVAEGLRKGPEEAKDNVPANFSAKAGISMP